METATMATQQTETDLVMLEDQDSIIHMDHSPHFGKTPKKAEEESSETKNPTFSDLNNYRSEIYIEGDDNEAPSMYNQPANTQARRFQKLNVIYRICVGVKENLK